MIAILLILQQVGNFSEVLQGVRVRTITREECLAQHPNINRRFIYENNTCSTSPIGQGFCVGDGGSPLVVGEGQTRFAIGIASWNMACGTGVPDVYVRLLDYITWINLNTLL